MAETLTFSGKAVVKTKAEGALRKAEIMAKKAMQQAKGGQLGDAVETLAKPLAKALKLPCLQPDGTLNPASGCEKRRDRLNALGSALGGVPVSTPPHRVFVDNMQEAQHALMQAKERQKDFIERKKKHNASGTNRI